MKDMRSLEIVNTKDLNICNAIKILKKLGKNFLLDIVNSFLKSSNIDKGCPFIAVSLLMKFFE